MPWVKQFTIILVGMITNNNREPAVQGYTAKPKAIQLSMIKKVWRCSDQFVFHKSGIAKSLAAFTISGAPLSSRPQSFSDRKAGYVAAQTIRH